MNKFAKHIDLLSSTYRAALVKAAEDKPAPAPEPTPAPTPTPAPAPTPGNPVVPIPAPPGSSIGSFGKNLPKDIRNALLGALIGSGIGGVGGTAMHLMSRSGKKKPLRNFLTGALLGAGLGGASGWALGHFENDKNNPVQNFNTFKDKFNTVVQEKGLASPEAISLATAYNAANGSKFKTVQEVDLALNGVRSNTTAIEDYASVGLDKIDRFAKGLFGEEYLTGLAGTSGAHFLGKGVMMNPQMQSAIWETAIKNFVPPQDLITDPVIQKFHQGLNGKNLGLFIRDMEKQTLTPQAQRYLDSLKATLKEEYQKFLKEQGGGFGNFKANRNLGFVGSIPTKVAIPLGTFAAGKYLSPTKSPSKPVFLADPKSVNLTTRDSK